MKVLNLKRGTLEWATPLVELSTDMKRLLQIRWRLFIDMLERADEPNCNPVVISTMERWFDVA